MLLDFLGRALSSRKREVKTHDAGVAKFAAFADDVFKKLDLTVVCPHCGGTPTGQNAPTDATWKLECACTVRVLTNPDRRGTH